MDIDPTPLDSDNDNPDSLDRLSYEEVYLWGKARFTLTRTIPSEEETRYLLLKVVEQAIRDYVSIRRQTRIGPADQNALETAQGFLFDDEYRIDWGGEILSLNQILEVLDLSQEWLRRKILELEANPIKNKKRIIENNEKDNPSPPANQLLSSPQDTA